MISYGKYWLLSSYVALDCEHIYEKCTQRYLDKVGSQWSLGKVLSYTEVRLVYILCCSEGVVSTVGGQMSGR